MGRPLNSKNKPKLIAVELSKLNEIFKPETKILISSSYSSILNIDPEQPQFIDDLKLNKQEHEELIEIRPINFSKL